MTNWKSGSLLLACALGLAACGDDGGNNRMDSGMDAAVEDASDSSVMDASDTSVPPNPALIRLAVVPFGFAPTQAFDICVLPQGSNTHILANADSLTAPTAKRSLPVGTITQHTFPAGALETVCAFPSASTCTVKIFRAEDVTFSAPIGTPLCGFTGTPTPVATVNLTPTTFQGAGAFTVALVGSASESSGSRAVHIEIFPDERVATEANKTRVRIVNFDPLAPQTSWEFCFDTNPTDPPLTTPPVTLLGDANSTATELNPLASRSAYFNRDPLAPTVLDPGPPPMILPVAFSVHQPAAPIHCGPLAEGVFVWPPVEEVNPGAAMLYDGYQAGVSQGGAMPLTSFAAGQVVTFYILRIPTGETTSAVVAIPMLDSPIPTN